LCAFTVGLFDDQVSSFFVLRILTTPISNSVYRRFIHYFQKNAFTSVFVIFICTFITTMIGGKVLQILVWL